MLSASIPERVADGQIRCYDGSLCNDRIRRRFSHTVKFLGDRLVACRVPLICLCGLMMSWAPPIGRLLSAADRPNVILVMTDDQGYGDLGCTGNPFQKTPHLDRLHSESIRLTDFHVSPFCTPTRAALMTGRYSARTGAYRTAAGRTNIHPREITMANVFATNGYRTGIFGKWHLGDNYPSRPIDKGFQKAVWHRCGGVTQVSDYFTNDYFDDIYLDEDRWKQFTGYCTDVWFDEAIRFIEHDQGTPFFVYIPTNAPHGPYLVADEYKRPYENCGENAAFKGMIANLDENMGRLLAMLEQEKLAENTILIFMTDNGSAAGCTMSKMGATRHAVDAFPVEGSFNAGMRGKKSSPYEGGQRVPFFIRWPAGLQQSSFDIDTLFAHIDVLPTLIDLCSLERTEGPELDGKSFASLLRAKDSKWPDRVVFSQIHGGAGYTSPNDPWLGSAVMTEQWRLVHGIELYDIVRDPGQRNDVSQKFPDVLARLRKAHEKWYETLKPMMVPTRIIVGSNAENPIDLTSQDWVMSEGGPPWAHSHITRRSLNSGAWHIHVDRRGEYRFILSRWPRYLKNDKNGKSYHIDSIAAGISVGGVEKRMQITEPTETTEVAFELLLEKGDTELSTWLETPDGQTHGAYFVTVERLTD